MECVVKDTIRKVGKWCFGLMAVCFLAAGSPALAQEARESFGKGGPALPSEFGEVIYQIHGDRPNQVYIIGQSHRSAATGANGSNTVKAQAEIFRIGEWLIEEQNVRLLLPEGYFNRRPEVTKAAVEMVSNEVTRGPRLDNETLHTMLSDTSIFVNADILLRNSFNIRLQQVEDERIYNAVRESMRSAHENAVIPAGFHHQVNYLQELRTAAMLQNIPVAVDREYRSGRISEKRAMFTIGMAHLSETIRFLEDGRIRIAAPPAGAVSADLPDFAAVMDLLDAGYGVTVILPRTLIDDREALRLVRLDHL